MLDYFGEWGQVDNVHLNLDRRTGYVKGYALIEYVTKEEAAQAVEEANNTELLGQIIEVAFAFVQGPSDSNIETIKESERTWERSRSQSPMIED